MRKEAFIPVDPIANANAFMEAFSLPEYAKEETKTIFGILTQERRRFFREQDLSSLHLNEFADKVRSHVIGFIDLLQENSPQGFSSGDAYTLCYEEAEKVAFPDQKKSGDIIFEDLEITPEGISLAFIASEGRGLFETLAWEGVKDSFDRISAGSNFDYLSDSIKAAGSVIDHAISFAAIRKSKKGRNPYLPLVKLMSMGAIGFHLSESGNELVAIDFAVRKNLESKILSFAFNSDFSEAQPDLRDWGEPFTGFVQLT